MPSTLQNERTREILSHLSALNFIPKVRNKFEHDLIMGLYFKTCLADMTLACAGLNMYNHYFTYEQRYKHLSLLPTKRLTAMSNT